MNAGHIVGFALLLGAIVPLDLRLMGVGRSVSIAALSRILIPVAAGGLILAIAMGALMFSIRAVQYAGTGLFRVKLLLIACGIANALLLHRAAAWEARSEGPEKPPLRLQIAGAVSIVTWLAVIVCGRMLAFLD